MNKNARVPLLLRIQKSGKVNQRVLREKDKFTVGQGLDNDLTLFGQEYPKRHTLFEKDNGFFKLYLPAYINDGQISVGESILNIRELMVHDILPKEKNNYVLKLSPAKKGYLTFGDTRIEFHFDRRKVRRHVQAKFDGFSWFNTVVQGLFSDLLFKSIFLSLLLINSLILYLFKDYEVKVSENVDVKKVQKRFAKFIMKTPEEILEVENKALMTTNTPESKEPSASKKRDNSKKRTSSRRRSSRPNNQRRGGGGNPAASSGLLSLIGGTGPSTKSSNVVDAMVDRGLVADLKNILGGGTNLKVGGKKTKDDFDPLDQLIGTGGSGGIDDFLSSMDEEVEEVTLKKKARVNLETAEKKTGDEEALGYRSDQSVMSVVNSRMGRITWLYEKYLKRQPNLRGKVSVEFTIAANGFVTSVRILESTVNHPQLESDIINLVKRLKFDPIPSGSTTFVFPFHFKKMN